MNQSSNCHFFTDFVLIEAHLILEYANNTMPIKNKIKNYQKNMIPV